MKIDTKLNLVEFVSVTEAIVNGYFDIDGEYMPHLGFANAIRLFYNICVEDSKYDNEIPHDFTDITLVDMLESDDEFMDAFEAAISSGKNRFSFGYAYSSAIDVVTTKRNSFAEGVKSILLYLTEALKGVMTPENIEATKAIAKDITEGKIDFTKVMTAYGDSSEFTNAIEKEQTDGKIIPFKAPGK